MTENFNLSGKKILVTGGTGMIGRALVDKLLQRNCEITIASIDKPKNSDKLLKSTEFIFCDLRNFQDTQKLAKNKDVIFHLAGIKGSPKMTAEKPSTFFTNTLMFNLNMMEAARIAGAQRYLFTSSVGVYSPSNVFVEDDVWKTFPSENDRFAGYAKRMGELQATANALEYGWNAVSIVRPANVYGPFDNFDSATGMVIPSLISRFASDENPIKIWGDGTAVRDFIYCDDVADGMIEVIEKNYTLPINLGSGTGTRISEIAAILKDIFPNKEFKWDTKMPKGDDVRIMDTTRAESIGIKNKIDIKHGLIKTAEWYLNNNSLADERYNAFKEER